MQKSLALLQMHEGEEVGLSSASSEFQEKMRLGDMCRLGLALLIPNELVDPEKPIKPLSNLMKCGIVCSRISLKALQMA
jgi:hypothetical protein